MYVSIAILCIVLLGCLVAGVPLAPVAWCELAVPIGGADSARCRCRSTVALCGCCWPCAPRFSLWHVAYIST